jgi:hypothetical protein
LGSFSKKRISLSLFCQCKSKNSVKGINFDQIVIFRPNDFPFFYLFLFVFNERAPSKDIFFHLILQLFIQYEPNSVSIAHYCRINVNSILKFLHSLFCNFSIMLKIVNLHFVELFDMKLVLLLSTCSCFHKDTNLRLIHN